MRSLVLDNSDLLSKEDCLNINELKMIGTLEDFDEFYTRRFYGYSSRTEYYESSSITNLICDVKRPLLCLHAKDDMINPLSSIIIRTKKRNIKLIFIVLVLPLDDIRASPNLALIGTKYGGHCGFVDGLCHSYPYLTERLAFQYLGAVAKYISHDKRPFGSLKLEDENSEESDDDVRIPLLI